MLPLTFATGLLFVSKFVELVLVDLFLPSPGKGTGTWF